MIEFHKVPFKTPGITPHAAITILERHWRWMVATGIGLLALGVLAFLTPIANAAEMTFTLASLFAASGIIQFIQAIKFRREQGGVTRFSQSLLAVITGSLFYFFPGMEMAGISLTLSFYFLISAVMQWMLAEAVSPLRTLFWLYLGSVTSFALGIYLILAFPLSAFWTPGTLLSIELLFTGTGLIGFALAIRKPRPKSSPSKGQKAA